MRPGRAARAPAVAVLVLLYAGPGVCAADDYDYRLAPEPVAPSLADALDDDILGGGGFIVLYLASEKKATTFDFRETAPA